MRLAPGDTVVFTARSPLTPKSMLAFHAGDVGRVVRCSVTHVVVEVAGVLAVAPFAKLQRVTPASRRPSDGRRAVAAAPGGAARDAGRRRSRRRGPGAM